MVLLLKAVQLLGKSPSNHCLFWQEIQYSNWHCMELESCFLWKLQTTGAWCRENGFLITVAIGSTIEIKLAQLTLHAPPAIIKDCKQMPKHPYFLFWGTYGAVFNLNFLRRVQGMLYSRALSPPTVTPRQGRALKCHAGRYSYHRMCSEILTKIN